MITFDDIAMDVDYEELGLIYNHLMHEKKRMSIEDLLKKYESGLLERIAPDDYTWNMGVAVLKELSGNKTILKPRKLDKLVADAFVMFSYEFWDTLDDIEKENLVKELNDTFINAMSTFKECGILYTDMDDVY